MNGFFAALYAEALKARRSLVVPMATAGLLLAPLMGGFFMLVLKDPVRARSMGLIGQKAQIVAGTADWPTYFGLLAQATAVGGLMVFSFLAAWVFGREFSEKTAKDLLALPTSRTAIVAAKFGVIAGIVLLQLALMFAVGLGVGAAVEMPGYSAALALEGARSVCLTGVLTLLLLPWVAFVASLGRGILGALGFAFLTLFLAQMAGAAGWGAVFPWAIPAMHSGVAGAHGGTLTFGSDLLVVVTGLGGLAATFAWWRWADQPK